MRFIGVNCSKGIGSASLPPPSWSTAAARSHHRSVLTRVIGAGGDDISPRGWPGLTADRPAWP
jgi:hypothetical protein